MAEKNYVTYGDQVGCGCGCGCSSGSKAITGCQFSLSVMADNFIDFIKNKRRGKINNNY